MKRLLLFVFLFPVQLIAQPSRQEVKRWEKQSRDVTIIRDNWGIPHIYGKTDADAVFGLLYAQCEDDFNRVEMNYIEKLGRMAEVKGEAFLYEDLLIRMVLDSAEAVSDYKKSPAWLQKLMNAFADGINYYLYKNPGVKPVLLTRFQQWYPLLWTDGSIGAISTAGATVAELKNFYTGSNDVTSVSSPLEEKATGSNGFAFSPSITESKNSILYINPHVTFYFRPEVHVVSGEGLNVYGAVTWGQFFVYQGFNEHCGWMHTSSDVDISELYIEKVSKKNNSFVYEYDHAQRPVISKKIQLHYLTGNSLQAKTINAYFTHHGPVMAKRNGQWLSMKATNRSLNGLIQSWQRNKTKSFADYKRTMNLLANTSNNTVYADAEGNIAYWHGNYIPVRDKKYDWSAPVDGSTSATEWKGLHGVDESIHLYNPANGWLQNCNSTPFTVAGAYSPRPQDYPAYMAPDPENFRGINAVRVLAKEKSYTIDKVIAAGYDTYLAAFEKLIPALVTAFEKNITPNDTAYTLLAGPVAELKKWDFHTGENSVPTFLAVLLGSRLLPSIMKTPVTGERIGMVEKMDNYILTVSPWELVNTFSTIINRVNQLNGTWRIKWGDENRFQRISPAIDQQFSDSLESLPVGFASATWGMLPSYNSRYYGTNKRYGKDGNSFICAVEFGKKIRAKSLLAGGQSGHPASKHFFDQGQMYTKGIFKDVLFYRGDVIKNMERKYHPGE